MLNEVDPNSTRQPARGLTLLRFARLAHPVEQSPCKRQVVGSRPTVGSQTRVEVQALLVTPLGFKSSSPLVGKGWQRWFALVS